MMIGLSIDGGGIRGIAPAMLLAFIEEKTGKPCADLFGSIAGTSTGGIIALGLACRIPAQQIVDLYVNHGPEIFDRSAWQVMTTLDGASGPKYDPAALEERLAQVFGDRLLSGLPASPAVLVPSWNLSAGAPRLFSNAPVGVPGDNLVLRGDYLIREVARATSAAPTYFPPAAVSVGASPAAYFIDGGVFANNPAADLRDLLKVPKILSLGTGDRRDPQDGADACSWGAPQWLPPIFPIFMQGQERLASMCCRAQLGSGFLRVGTELPAPVATAFDDVSPENIGALKAWANALIEAHGQEILDFVGSESKGSGVS